MPGHAVPAIVDLSDDCTKERYGFLFNIVRSSRISRRVFACLRLNREKIFIPILTANS